MRARTAHWAVVTCLLGLVGCQSGGGWPSWKTSSKTPAYSGVAVGQQSPPSYNVPPTSGATADTTPYGTQASAGAYDGGVDAQSYASGGVYPGAADATGQAGYGATVADPYPTTPAAAGATNYYDPNYATTSGASTAASSAGQDYGAAEQQAIRTADARYTDPVRDTGRYSTPSRYDTGSGYPSSAGGQTRYNDSTTGNSWEGAASAASNPDQSAYQPGHSDYQPGDTGFAPPGVAPYKSPTGQYRPGSTRDHSPAGTARGSAATSTSRTATNGYNLNTNDSRYDASANGVASDRYGESLNQGSSAAISPADASYK